MSTVLLEEVGRLTRLEKLQLARYLLDVIAGEEKSGEIELELQLERRWLEIEAGEAELFTGEQLNSEIESRYGWKISLP